MSAETEQFPDVHFYDYTLQWGRAQMSAEMCSGMKQQREILDVLVERSRAKCDVEPGICWFKDATGLRSIATLQSWTQSFATAGVVLFIAALCGVWFYSHLEAKAPETARLPEKQEVLPMEGRSQIPAEVTLTGTGTMTSSGQSTPTPAVLMTSVASQPPEYSASRADTLEQKKTATNHSEHRALQSPSPDTDKRLFASYAGKASYYRSPYTGRVFNLRRVRDGGLVLDPDTGRLFRRPGKKRNQIPPRTNLVKIPPGDSAQPVYGADLGQADRAKGYHGLRSLTQASTE